MSRHAYLCSSPSLRVFFYFILFSRGQVVLGDIFKGQTGDVWAKGVALEIELENSARDEDGKPLPVKVNRVNARTNN